MYEHNCVHRNLFEERKKYSKSIRNLTPSYLLTFLLRSYGGDPDQVTLMGQSAGSFSATYHLVSPLSKYNLSTIKEFLLEYLGTAWKKVVVLGGRDQKLQLFVFASNRYRGLKICKITMKLLQDF